MYLHVLILRRNPTTNIRIMVKIYFYFDWINIEHIFFSTKIFNRFIKWYQYGTVNIVICIVAVAICVHVGVTALLLLLMLTIILSFNSVASLLLPATQLLSPSSSQFSNQRFIYANFQSRVQFVHSHDYYYNFFSVSFKFSPGHLMVSRQWVPRIIGV